MPDPEKLKLHYNHFGQPACACHDVERAQLTTAAETTCLRCAHTRAWREAMGLPSGTTGYQASAICRNGRQVVFQRTLETGWTAHRMPTTFRLLCGRKVVWRELADVTDTDAMRAKAKAWATEHGFELA